MNSVFTKRLKTKYFITQLSKYLAFHIPLKIDLEEN